MISATRMLCQKYTSLTDDEISYLESYNTLLPAMANAEKADVFVDCRTATGRSAIVVCEAKPQTVPSNYSSSILGMMIQWSDEPAVDRSFRLGVSTAGMRAVSMPEDRRIVQSVDPIFYRGRLIAVLIYEKPAMDVESILSASQPAPTDTSADLGWSAVADALGEAVVFLDQNRQVCGYNREAERLYRAMGYVGELLGMPGSNIQPAAAEACDGAWHETCMVNRNLQYRKLSLTDGKAAEVLIMRDITEQRRLEQELNFQKTALRELRHRMKNSLQMMANLIRARGYEVESLTEAQSGMMDAANRLLSLTATLDGPVQASPEKVSLLQVIRHIRQYTLQTLVNSTGNITIQVSGQDVEVRPDCADSIALVVNELLQNALKHAFPSGAAGTVWIELQSGRPASRITVRDNGVGLQKDQTRSGGIGLELVYTIVRDRLMGECDLESGPDGTRVTFDFIEA